MIRSYRRHKNMGLLLSGAACLVMAVVAVDQWSALDEPIQIQVSLVATPPNDQIAAPPVNLPVVDVAQLKKVIERPLFSPSRRPPPPQPVVQPTQPSLPLVQAAPPVLDFALVGIIRIGDTPIALVQPQDGHPAQRLQAGDQFHGWVLTAISEDRAMFRSNGQSKELVLDFRRSSAPASP